MRTAKKDITSEGVFGLQRAFKMAAIQVIIMSILYATMTMKILQHTTKESNFGEQK